MTALETKRSRVTAEQWCRDLIRSESVKGKYDAGLAHTRIDSFTWENPPTPERFAQPGRPPEWTVIDRSPKTPRKGAIKHAAQRIRLFQTLAHHELQAAELFAWAVLTWPQTPLSFRQGLLRIAFEELGHLNLYRKHIQVLGGQTTNLEVRDWFWERVHGCETPLEFICFMGLGFEAANLEHSARFAGWFREGGDEAGAKVLDIVERDEVKHVAFGRKWFEEWTGEELRFDTWRAQLPAPLTPSVFRGLPLNRKARQQAGLPEHFLRDLETYSPADQPLRVRNHD